MGEAADADWPRVEWRRSRVACGRTRASRGDASWAEQRQDGGGHWGGDGYEREGGVGRVRHGLRCGAGASEGRMEWRC